MYTHMWMHAYIEMTTRRMMMVMMSLPSSSHPLHALKSIFSGGDRGGGGIDRRVDAVDSCDVECGFMNDRKAMLMRKCVMIGSRMTYPL